jgi:peptidoglycan/xylan/chitin deacetylase (PgdA/CDA1 family)
MTGKLKQYAVLTLAGVLYYSGAFRLWLALRHRLSGGQETCVLALHRVLSEQQLLNSNSLPGIILREETFARILRFLARNFSVLTLDLFLGDRAHGARNSKPTCLITFDDGWKDNYTTALPLLKKHRLPATVFVITGMLGTSRTFWVERLIGAWRDPKGRKQLQGSLAKAVGAKPFQDGIEGIVETLKHMAASQRKSLVESALGGEGNTTADGDAMLTWEEAAAMQAAGVDIEAHSVTHPLLVYENDSALNQEVQDGKRVLEERLGKKVRAFAYPNGTWDGRVRKVVEESGYECAFSTTRGWHRRGDDLFAIRRIMLHEGSVTGPRGRFSPALLSLRLSGWI